METASSCGIVLYQYGLGTAFCVSTAAVYYAVLFVELCPAVQPTLEHRKPQVYWAYWACANHVSASEPELPRCRPSTTASFKRPPSKNSETQNYIHFLLQFELNIHFVAVYLDFPNLIQYCMRYEVLTVVNVKIIVFSEVTPFSFVGRYHLLRELNWLTCKFYKFSSYVISKIAFLFLCSKFQVFSWEFSHRELVICVYP